MSKRNKKISVLLFSAVLLILSISAGLMFGSVKMTFDELAENLLNNGTIIYNIRLPRVLSAGLAGAALSCAGLILQCVTANPLCAPNIVGINSGAGFFVILILCLFPSRWRFIPIGAFAGALMTSFLVLALSSVNRIHTKTTLVLSGVAVSSILNAAISFLSLRYPDTLSSYTAFSVGGFSGSELEKLKIPFVIILVSVLFLQLVSPKLSVLCLGDEIAHTLGVNVRIIRILAVTASSALCASAVSFAGLLGFVGLIVPHIVKHIAGEDIRLNIPLCILNGASLVILSDLLGRVVFRPTELPAGIIMALIGAPFFLFLLIKRSVHHD